ncbi:MAG: alpha/beta hydrolase family esterase, partial [Acidimicrobiia bacterium]
MRISRAAPLLACLVATAGIMAVPAAAGAPEASAGCDAATPVAPGEERVTTTSGGTERWYHRHVPPAHDGRQPVPVVIDLHGYLEGADVHKVHSDLGTYGDEQGFVTITPHGSGPVVRWDAVVDSADMTFIGDLLDEVEATLCVDERRIFVTGLSNGAFMTSAIACAYADQIAAAAPIAGISDIDGCEPDRAVPVVAFHGTDDGFVAIDGGLGED